MARTCDDNEYPLTKSIPPVFCATWSKYGFVDGKERFDAADMRSVWADVHCVVGIARKDVSDRLQFGLLRRIQQKSFNLATRQSKLQHTIAN